MPQSQRTNRDPPSLSFIVIEQPSDTRNAHIRRQVRSHVTKLQHRRTREKYAGRYSKSRSLDIDRSATSSVEQDKQTRSQFVRSRSPAGGFENPRDTSAESFRAPSTRRGSEAYTSSPQDESHWSSNGTRSAAAVYAEMLALASCELPKGTLELSFSRGEVAFRTFALNDPTNAVGRSLDGLDLRASSVLSCYNFIVHLQAQDFDRHFPLSPPGTSHQRFMSFLCAEPALLTAAILVTTRYLLVRQGRPLQAKERYNMLLLQGQAIRSMNAALQDPVRSVSDRMLTAVALLAAYELKHGTREGFQAHMEGLVRMINLRGGLPEIGRADPYTERFLLWHDANTTSIAGCESYCQRVEKPSLESLPPADDRMFRLREKPMKDHDRISVHARLAP